MIWYIMCSHMSTLFIYINFRKYWFQCWWIFVCKLYDYVLGFSNVYTLLKFIEQLLHNNCFTILSILSVSSLSQSLSHLCNILLTIWAFQYFILHYILTLQWKYYIILTCIYQNIYNMLLTVTINRFNIILLMNCK